ncbi:MAG TPA: alpha/beta hydrolase [Rhodanobacteraceae bacterium]|nr:alpha/beta hydrolase [Rhodanobacteraceae bacterium]
MNHKPAVLILPGLGNSGPEHWQSHWERRDPSLERVIQDEWEAPLCQDWIEQLSRVLLQHSAQVVLVAHSSACALIAHWAASASEQLLERVCGALLVAPSDPENPNYPAGPTGFAPVPMIRLPFLSIVVASSDDRYVDPRLAFRCAAAWGSRFVLLDSAGHINAAAGFGPWPEGYALLDSLRTAELVDG